MYLELFTAYAFWAGVLLTIVLGLLCALAYFYATDEDLTRGDDRRVGWGPTAVTTPVSRASTGRKARSAARHWGKRDTVAIVVALLVCVLLTTFADGAVL